MCEPVSISTGTALAISAVVAAVGTGVTLYGQSEAASANAKYQVAAATARNREIEENYALALKSYHLQANSLNDRAAQENERVSTADQQNVIRAAQARATARTAAGEAGVAGLSVDALLRDFTAQESRYREGLYRNNEFVQRNIASEKDAARLVAEGRSNQIQPFVAQPIAQPNYLGETFKLGANLFNQYTQFNSQRPRGVSSSLFQEA